MLIVDAHLDLSWNALQWGRDLTRSVYTIRTQENTTPGKGRGLGTVAYPEMRQGRVALCIATLIARSTGQPAPHVDYATPMQAYGVAQGQLAYYRALERTGETRIIADLAGLNQHVAEWEAWEREEETKGQADKETGENRNSSPTDRRSSLSVHRSPPLGFVISMEGADPIVEPEQLAAWYDAGLRLLGLTHYGPGRYAGGTATELGLTELGPPLLAEMTRLGVVLDLTHCSDQSFWQALEHYDGPAIASHNNCRALVPHQRQFDDDQLRAIAERDGVIGAALDAWMLKPGWSIGASTNPAVTLSDVAEQIDYICQLTGSSRHAAIGSDLDGGFGREQSPQDLDTIADLQKLAGLLSARGYTADDIAAIMHGNWLRLLRRVWAD
jgi:membrane dipeptidase